MLSVIAGRPEPLIFVFNPAVTAAVITAITDPETGDPVATYDGDGEEVTFPVALSKTDGLQGVWYSPQMQWQDDGTWIVSVDLTGADDVEEQLQVRGLSAPPGPAPGGGFYCTIGDVRAEGVTEAMASDDRLVWTVWMVCRDIDKRTGFRFGAWERTFHLDGTGHKNLLLNEPIVSIDRVADHNPGNGATVDYLDDDFVVYNRHIRLGLTDPDDRYNPKIVMLGGGTWAEGEQNVLVEGKFGFTDYDGTDDGRVPDLIRRAAVLLAVDRYVAAASDEADEVGQRRRLIKERTRDQSYEISPLASLASAAADTTGNAEVDQILEMYQSPPAIGCV